MLSRFVARLQLWCLRHSVDSTQRELIQWLDNHYYTCTTCEVQFNITDLGTGSAYTETDYCEDHFCDMCVREGYAREWIEDYNRETLDDREYMQLVTRGA